MSSYDQFLDEFNVLKKYKTTKIIRLVVLFITVFIMKKKKKKQK